ncbi:dixin isoform X4 [Pseudopipra pipra]|uniref:dixin isoform X4 n=1 Tax=Pseudopipra pipra TaxID=415032 RepID=UPI00313919E4
MIKACVQCETMESGMGFPCVLEEFCPPDILSTAKKMQMCVNGPKAVALGYIFCRKLKEWVIFPLCFNYIQTFFFLSVLPVRKFFAFYLIYLLFPSGFKECWYLPLGAELSMGTVMDTVPCHPPPAPSQQLQAYVAWVNSQLKKKPTVKPVQDLRQDLRDGVTLALLIEIVAGEKLSGIEANPTSQQEMRENVEKVLQFVASKKIRMHQTSAKDIVDGNLKSTMRLILALAAHFKPGSGRAVGASGAGPVGKGWAVPPGSHRPRSAAAMAQGAVAALAEVRQDVLHSGRDVFRHRHRNSSMDEEIENPYWSVRALVQQYEGQQNVPLESHSSR